LHTKHTQSTEQEYFSL